MKELPKGLVDFRKIIKEGYIYVDKTKYIYKMIKENQYVFLSRPRRFGKSLTVSVLEYLFRGEKDLFKNTWIYDKWDWKEYPVVKLDLNNIDTTNPANFEISLASRFRDIAKMYDVQITQGILSEQFYDLIVNISVKYNEPVVLLIDEYEKTILDHISDKQKANEMRQILRQVYGRIKSLDQYLRFVFFTGITKYTKAGVFSTLNNLNDISLDTPYSRMLGYSLEEIQEYFPEYINDACEKLGMSKEYLLEKLEKHYGGFSFDGEHFVFNPFAVLLFFEKKEFLNFWSQTAQPNFLYDYLRSNEVNVEDILIESGTITVDELLSREIEDVTAKSFLVQAGYLTFKEKIDVGEYRIGIPNLDAGSGMTRMLMEIKYGIDYQNEKTKAIGRNLRKAVQNEDVELLINSLKEGLGQISYGVHKNDELTYEAIIIGLLIGSQIRAQAEREVSGGRIDILIENNGVVYVIELKVDKSAKEALEQIKERRYHEGFSSKRCYLIGVNISSSVRNIQEWTYEVVNPI